MRKLSQSSRRRGRFPAIAVTAVAVMLGGCKVELSRGLKEKEANEMLSQLLAHNLSASKKTEKDNTITLLIEEAQFAEAVQTLKRLGLPRRRFTSLGEVFAPEGLVSSPVQEWARLNYALTQELSNTISSIPGVVSAEVHVANPRKTAPFERAPPPSASVLVLVAKDAITAELIPQVKQLVAFSVENIDYDRVAVIVSPVDLPKPQPAAMVNLAGIILQKASYSRAVLMLAGTGLLATLLGAAGAFLFKARGGTP
ncbi:type III secretion protein J [Bradyrhizobium sp. USDA 4524]|uniref:type III secretion system inner membrane ring lipoprotein SctJ n=1 Tax=unclassified Bradyrhizobium TaxID=2631580 RepID=UPI00209F830A|nr:MULTISPECIES: type III secretion inner membrane ring lipoprotein SctJ [unclassified Bradyrhizobium]MCP1846094.1 type III secretion protein J [Bradyrhizobium sp. USDA 4538]MCP1907272.1 type III secretion protein J [Bradyrhizobium sp. USDA 4537]MCP1985747.1 type III secretion protein J [Bradyrhizobium sp. USDA 4539]